MPNYLDVDRTADGGGATANSAATPTGDPAWVRPAFLALLLITGVLYIWGLDKSGWANAFYSAAAQAGSVGWKAFFYGSSDAANSITVDKTPAALRNRRRHRLTATHLGGLPEKGRGRALKHVWTHSDAAAADGRGQTTTPGATSCRACSSSP